MTPKKFAEKIAQLTLTKKAEEVKIIDLRKVTSLTDFFVICSGDTDIQVKAIADAVIEGLLKSKNKPWHKEGFEAGTWILLDFVDVVVHIFRNDKRSYYKLENLWGDAPVVTIADNSDTNSGEKT